MGSVSTKANLPNKHKNFFLCSNPTGTEPVKAEYSITNANDNIDDDFRESNVGLYYTNPKTKEQKKIFQFKHAKNYSKPKVFQVRADVYCFMFLKLMDD